MSLCFDVIWGLSQLIIVLLSLRLSRLLHTLAARSGRLWGVPSVEVYSSVYS